MADGTLIRRYFSFVLRHRAGLLLVCALATLVALGIASQAVVASSIGKLFLGEMPDYLRYQERMRTFGNDELFLVAYEDPAPLSPESLARLEQATAVIAADPEVARVVSLLDAAELGEGPGGLRVRRYAELAAQTSPAEAAAALAADPLYEGTLLARDGSAAALLVELTVDPYRSGESIPPLVHTALGALEDAGYPREALHCVGLPPLIAEIMEQTRLNLTRLFPLSGLALLSVVWLLFRRVTPALVTLGVALVSVSWTLGFAALLDREFSVLTAIVPAVVLTVAFSDIVHLWSAYLLELEAGRGKEEAILESATDVGRACLLTSLTTFTGFISLAAIPTPASRQLGVVMGFGVGAALLLAMTLVPVALSYLPAPPPRPERGPDLLDRAVALCAELSIRRAPAVLAGFGLLLIPIGWWASRFTIDTDFSGRFEDDNVYVQDQRFFEGRFDGASTVSLIVEAAEPGGLADPEVFRKLAALHDAAEVTPGVDGVRSPVDVMRALNRALKGEEGLPRGPGAVSQYLLMLELAGGEDVLGGQLDFERTTARLEVRTSESGFRELGRLGGALEAEGRALLGEAATVEATGVSYLLGSYFDKILAGQRAGLAFSLGTIGVMMAVGLRSLRAGALSMLPNLLPLAALLAAATAAMGAVDSDVLITCLIALGIGVDDTIHFLMRYRVEARRAAPGDTEGPLRRTFHFAGRAIVMTTVILCVGFAPFVLSDYLTLYMFGTLLPLALVVAVLADLLLVPAMARVGMFRMEGRNLR
jgi:predicted RND superfamily exporter protein